MKRILSSMAALLVGTMLPAAERPNILLIMADDLGYGDLSAYGSEIPTPRIDTLARDGARLSAFYTPAAVCTPSRYGMLTGRWPNRSRDNLLSPLMFLQTRDDGRGLRATETTVTTRLRAAGYRTALVGKWHLGHGEAEFLPQQHGFEHVYGCRGGCVDFFTLKYGEKPDWYRGLEPLQEEGYSTDLITAEAVRWLESRRADEPFFLFLSYTAPHYGKGWDPVARQPTNVLQAKPADRERHHAIVDPDRREYAGMVTALDEGVGRVLATLEERGLAARTLVIFTSDNGGDTNYGGRNGGLRGRKSQLFEGGIRVPCLVRWPGRIAPGRVIDEPVTGLDFFPTIAAVARLEAAAMPVDGNNILPVLLGGRLPESPRALFWQSPRGKALRQGDWKYVQEEGVDRLFHLARDPAEQDDLAQREPERLAALRKVHAGIGAGIRQDRGR